MWLRALSALVLVAATLLPRAGGALETNAGSALVVDHQTGAVLLAKNADAPLPPASMSKLMTLLMVFEALEEGRLTLDDTFPVSARAQAMGGSTMYLDTTDNVRVEDLILGIVVQSGNDACVVVAEGLAGSEEAFAEQMTVRGREIGLTQSVFKNSSGWPDPEHRMSARDLVTVARRIIDAHPEYYTYFAYEEFGFDGRAPANRFNRNPILGQGIGADGLKTGHTVEAGYGLVGSATDGERRVTFMITGIDTARERAVEAERLVTWAFREFENRALFTAGDEIAAAEVWLGASETVPLVAGEDVIVTLPRANPATAATVHYEAPLPAPIAEGDRLAEMVITADGMEPVTVPLEAGVAVEGGGFLTRFSGALGLVGREILSALRNAIAS
ncbi:MAG: D-alanyl-D-alanine carboxypeptidase family protein [Pseudomonadota bacterium]